MRGSADAPRCWLPFAVVVATACGGCDVFDPALLDAGGDAGTDADAAPSDGGCMLRHPPPRPEVEDGPDGDEAVFALRDVLLEQGRGVWRDVGFDLDGVCSNGPDPELSCAPPEGTVPEPDGNDGIDNSAGHNLLQLADVAVDDSLQMDARGTQARGNGAFLLRVRGWNHEPDDPSVDVVFAVGRVGAPPEPDGSAPPVVTNDDGEVMLEDGGGAVPVPEWEGQDWFWARSDGFVGGNEDLPRLRDEDAYVAGGILVLRFNERVDLVFGDMEQGVIVRVRGTVVSLPIVSDDEGPVLGTAVFGSRWAREDVLETAEHVGVCPDSAGYDAIAGTLSEAVDVTSDLSADESATCDALSIGTTLKVYRGRWAGVLDPKPVPNFCEIMMMDGGVPDGGASDAGATDGGARDGG